MTTDPCPPPTCERCKLPYGTEANHCGDFGDGDYPGGSVRQLIARVACRDREVGSLQAQLRGIRRKLSKFVEDLDDLLERMP